MNLMYFFTFSLVSSTVYANPEVPLAFFAKGADGLKPLIALPQSLADGVFHKLSYQIMGNDYSPIEFTLLGRHALTKQTASPGYASFHENYFGMHPRTTPLKLKWNKEMKLLNRPFYSCKLSSRTHRFIMSTNEQETCFQVDVYLLPYDHVSKSAVPAVPPNLPMAFFANVNGNLEPLSSIYLGESFDNLSLFTHRHPTASAVKIRYVDHTAYIHPTRFFMDWVGFYEGEFMSGPSIPHTIIRLSSNWRILHGPFYSCALNTKRPESVRAISNHVPWDFSSSCFEVEIFLLPYRRINGTAYTHNNTAYNGTGTAYTENVGAHKGTATSIEYLYEEDYQTRGDSNVSGDYKVPEFILRKDYYAEEKD